jgi:pimeloyl-ACP methyl ester carboxylesterase
MNKKKVISRHALVVIASLLLAFLPACSGGAFSQPTATPLAAIAPASGLKEVKCPFFVAQDLNITCGTIEVPEDYSEIDGEQIEIMAVVVHSQNPNPARDPVVLLGFDAASSFLEFVPYIARSFGPLLEERDGLFYSFRGHGEPGPALDCPEFYEAYLQTWLDDFSMEQELALYLPVMQTCQERLLNDEIDPTVYSIDALTTDLNTLRLALGYSQLNLISGAFGSELALTMIRNYPQAVRSAVIMDFSMPIAYVTQETYAVGLQHSLDAFFNLCSNDEDCRLAFPGLESQFYQVVDNLNLRPAEVKVFLPNQSNLTTVKVSGDDFVQLVGDMLYSRTTIAQIPNLILDTYNGDVGKMSIPLQQIRMQQPENSHIGLQFSTLCAELHANFWQSTTAMQDVHPAVQSAIGTDWLAMQELCSTWTGHGPAAPEGQPLRSDVPVLVFHGELNPRISSDQISELLQGMGNSTLLTVPNMSSDVFGGDSCSGNLFYEWMTDPEVRLDTACLEQTEAIEFTMPP